jgi:hypothetical protein
MRLLVVIADELLLGRNEAREWAFLESLVASSPDRLEVEVLALTSEPSRSFAFANPLGQGAGGMAASGAGSPPVPHDPAGSARQRLDRASQHLRSLGMQVTGDVVSGDPYRIVRDQAEADSYDRVLLVLNERHSPLARIAGRAIETRLRRVLSIPVDAVTRPELA